MNKEHIKDLLGEILKTMKENNFFGIQIGKEFTDIENLQLAVEFITTLKDGLNVPVFVTIDRKTCSSDYFLRQISNKVNYINLQVDSFNLYDEPYAVAPINVVKRAIIDTIKFIPSNKVLLEIPMYGYDWVIPLVPEESAVQKISPQHAVFTAARNGSYIALNKTALAPYFYYKDLEDKQHVVWFEDVRSLYSKLKTVHDYRLAGVNLQSIENPFPQIWYLLSEFYNVKKF